MKNYDVILRWIPLSKGAIPREDVLRVRDDYFKLLSPCGVLKPGTKPVEGIYNGAEDISKFHGIGSGTDALRVLLALLERFFHALEEGIQLDVQPLHIFFTVAWSYSRIPVLAAFNVHVGGGHTYLLPNVPICLGLAPSSRCAASCSRLRSQSLPACAMLSHELSRMNPFPTYGKYRSVCAGRTSAFALIPCIAAWKSPLYGSC